MVFDELWLARCITADVAAEDGIRHQRLHDPASGQRWYARRARRADAQACQRLGNEARLLPRLDPAWAALPVATFWTAQDMVLVSAPEHEPALAGVVQALPAEEFRRYAIGAARALAGAHAQGLVHGDIRPFHLVHGERLLLSGFGCAMVQQESAIRLPGSQAWPYRAPETLGAPDTCDARADLYALGATFYEWLTGAPPFAAASAAAWEHAHLAVEPAMPDRPDVPRALLQTVLRLLAKEPGLRHASADALLSDLMGRASEAPALAVTSKTPGEQLFGREAELQTLQAALGRVQAGQGAEAVLIAGASGSGKSALVQRLAREAGPAVALASGKCDLQQDILYAPVAQALRGLVADWRSQPRPALAEVWRELLAGQGRAVAEIVPEVEQILGPTAPLSNVAAAQAQRRAENAMLQTLAAFGSERALLLFIDDVQWADAGTRAFLRAFVARPPGNVLLVCTYRDSADMDWLGRPDGVRMERLTLAPLELPALTGLVAEALNDAPERAQGLAAVLHGMTGGNPFFTVQLLRTALEDGSVQLEHGRWQWCESRPVPVSVIELMAQRLAPAAGEGLLHVLACLGQRTSTARLAAIEGLREDEVHQRLLELRAAGLLRRDGDDYVFAHDCILEAAYGLMDPAQRAALHGRIARLLIGERSIAALLDDAYEITNQIERAGPVPLSLRPAFARALVAAGRRAKNAAALARAHAFVGSALRLMDQSWWRGHYQEAYAASLLNCECQFARTDLQRTQDEIQALLARDLPALDRAAVYRLQASVLTVQSDYEGAISSALTGLALLGVQLERGPDAAALRQAHDSVRAAMLGRRIDELAQLPASRDPQMHAVMGLLSTLISSLFVTDGISFLHVAKMTELTLKHGVTPESAYGLSWYGVFIASLYGEYQEGLAFGQAALALIDHHGFEAERIATLVAVDQVCPWTRPLSEALDYARQAARIGRDSGDVGMACYAWNHIVSDLLAMAEPLPLVEEAIESGLAMTRQVQYRDIELILSSQKHFLRRLRGEPWQESWRQREQVASAAERLELSNSQPTRFWIALYDGMASVFLRDWDGAAARLRTAADLIWSAPAHINVADCELYLALALARTEPADAHLVAAHEKFVRWAALNPLTFRNKEWLLEAEIARLRGDGLAALQAYERSAQAAGAAGLTHEQALAQEFAAAVCEELGLTTASSQHVRAAIDAYRLWGATRKEQQLAPPALEQADAPDWQMGMRAAQALSGEVVMVRLVETLMGNILIHAGAQYGVLLRGETPMIEACGRIEHGRLNITVERRAPTDNDLPLNVLNSVMRSRKAMVLADASAQAPSIDGRPGLRSLLCFPLLRGGAVIGAFYLENNLAPGVFDARRAAGLEVLAPQVALSLETAGLYEQLLDENSRRARAEVDLRAARAELASRSHLTVMGSLAASIAHEVNQPLTAVVASVDASLRWLRRATPDLGEAVDGLEHIKANALRAGEIIRALRALAKQAPAVLGPVGIDVMVTDVLDMMRDEIALRQVALVTRLGVSGLEVDADKVQLQQVVVNLIANALDAMRDMPREQRELVIESAREGDALLVSVKDMGAGIDDEVLPRIFEPFFTTKSDGMGMGLAICQSIIEAHGGALQARRREGGGSHFWFRLPLHGA